MSYADWMANIPDKLKQCPLSQIAIPGTHDSATCDISMNSSIGPDLEYYLKVLDKITCNVFKKIIVNWTITQNLNLTEQMNGGIRYFDLRLAFDAKTKDLYFTHGLLSTTLKQGLMDISDFLKAHSGEILLLDFNHFYSMDEDRHAVAGQIIMSYLKDQLFPMPSDSTIPSIKECIASNKRVLLFYHESKINQKFPFWVGSSIPSPWPNTDDVSKLIRYLETNYKNGRHSSSFYVTQGVITPETSYIIKNVCRSLRCVTMRTNAAFIDWVKTKNIGDEGINICIVDFFEDKDYVSAILALNR